MRLLPKSIHWCRRYPTKFNSGRDIPALTAPLSVSSGQVLTWELSGANDLYHSITNTYADGQASQSWADFAMRILMCP